MIPVFCSCICALIFLAVFFSFYGFKILIVLHSLFLWQAFHVRLCKLTTDRFVPFQVLIPEIGKFIKQLPDAPINEILQYISHNVFEDDSKLNDIKLSYSSYLIHAKPSNIVVLFVFDTVIQIQWSKLMSNALQSISFLKLSLEFDEIVLNESVNQRIRIFYHSFLFLYLMIRVLHFYRSSRYLTCASEFDIENARF